MSMIERCPRSRVTQSTGSCWTPGKRTTPMFGHAAGSSNVLSGIDWMPLVADAFRLEHRPQRRRQDLVVRVDAADQRPVARRQVVSSVRLRDPDPEVAEAAAAKQDHVARAEEGRAVGTPPLDPGHVGFGPALLVLVEGRVRFCVGGSSDGQHVRRSIARRYGPGRAAGPCSRWAKPGRACEPARPTG